MLRLIAAVGVASAWTLAACAPRAAPSPAPISATVRLDAADALVEAGCLDCLVDAHREFEILRSDPVSGSRAAAGAVRSAVLIAIREHELGLADSGHLEGARQALGTMASSPDLDTIVAIAEALTAPASGPTRTGSQAQTLAYARISTNQKAWAEALRTRLPMDRTSAYLWLSLACGTYSSSLPDSDNRQAVVGEASAATIVAFKEAASCARGSSAPLQRIFDRQPRFQEVQYFLGLSALRGQPAPGAPGGVPDLEGADRHFASAYEWRQDWPALTLAIANLAVTAEDFERAVAFYDRTILLVPAHPDALLGKIRTLTYLQRHADAIAVTDELIAIDVTVGDARYWRALNEEQLGRHDDAWDDIERADRLIVNADVPKLAGIIAINRRQLDVARAKLDLALSRRPSDCDTAFYLQTVLSEQRLWERAASVAAGCAECFDAEEARALREIEDLRSSPLPPERRDRQIARRERQIAQNARMRANAWFNAAAAHYNTGRKNDARLFAEKVTDDPQFGVRAAELLKLVSR